MPTNVCVTISFWIRLHFPAILKAGVSTWMSFSLQLPAVVQEHTYTYRCSFLPFPNSMWRQRSKGIWRHLIQETKLRSSITDLTELWRKWEIDFYLLQLLRSWSWSSPFWIHLSQFTSSCIESLLIQVNMPVPLTITLMAWIQPPGLSPLNTFYFACMTLKVVSTKRSSSSEVGHDQCRTNTIITFSSRCYGSNDGACDACPLSLFKWCLSSAMSSLSHNYRFISWAIRAFKSLSHYVLFASFPQLLPTCMPMGSLLLLPF